MQKAKAEGRRFRVEADSPGTGPEASGSGASGPEESGASGDDESGSESGASGPEKDDESGPAAAKSFNFRGHKCVLRTSMYIFILYYNITILYFKKMYFTIYALIFLYSYILFV